MYIISLAQQIKSYVLIARYNQAIIIEIDSILRFRMYWVWGLGEMDDRYVLQY